MLRSTSHSTGLPHHVYSNSNGQVPGSHPHTQPPPAYTDGAYFSSSVSHSSTLPAATPHRRHHSTATSTSHHSHHPGFTNAVGNPPTAYQKLPTPPALSSGRPSLSASAVVSAITDLAVSFHTTTGSVPPPLAGASMTVIDHMLYLFAGRLVATRKMTNELYTLNLHTLVWRHHADIPGQGSPEARYFHSANVFAKDSIIIFGGMGQRRVREGQDTSIVLGDIMVLETRGGRLKWKRPTVMGVPPRPRYAHLTVVDGKRLVVLGGQDLQNAYIQDAHVLDLETFSWILSVDFPRQCGVYRSISIRSNSKCFVYSNFNFTDVKRELHAIDIDTLQTVDQSVSMKGSDLPPGLRFPNGHLMGNSLVVSGTFLTNSMQRFCVWRLNLDTFQWSRLHVGRHLDDGSWNKAVLDGARDRYLIFGNRNRDLLTDYEHRRVNFDHVVSVKLDAWGLFDQPRKLAASYAQDIGMTLLKDPQFCDFMILASGNAEGDQRSAKPDPNAPDPESLKIKAKGVAGIRVNSSIIRRRWPYFDRLLVTNPSPDRTLSLPETITVLKAFIEFLYCNTLAENLPLDILGELLCLAEVYGLDQLEKSAAMLMHRYLDNVPTCAWSVFCYARRAGNVGLRVRSLLVMETPEGRSWLENGNGEWWRDSSEEDAREEVVNLVGVTWRPSAATSSSG